MKKFGKKNFMKNYCDMELSAEYDDDEDNFFEKEYSKRLNKKKFPEKEKEEKYFLFKKNKKNSNLDSISNLSARNENVNPEEKINTKPRLIRLSELENSNLYFILNIDQGSNKEAIKSAYKHLCLSKHPDKGGNSVTFQNINRAYRILSNDLCRKLYDNFSNMAMTLIDDILDNSRESMQHILDDRVDLSSLDLEAVREIIKINAKN